MARAWNRLSANFVRGASKRGRYADGGNLHLQIAAAAAGVGLSNISATARSGRWAWAPRAVPLSLARELAGDCREQLARGIDPIDARKAAALAQQAARAKLMTFKECAEEYHAANATRWTNAKHRNEWLSTLRRFAFPVIGHLSVDMIDSAHHAEGVAAAGDREADHGCASARPDRDRARLRQGGRTAQRRKSGRQGDHRPHAADAFGKVRRRRISPPCRSPSCPS